MKRISLAFGIVLLVFGIVGLVHPTFEYHTKEKVADIGPIHATVDQEKSVEIPKLASVAALLAGLVLVISSQRAKT